MAEECQARCVPTESDLWMCQTQSRSGGGNYMPQGALLIIKKQLTRLLEQ